VVEGGALGVEVHVAVAACHTFRRVRGDLELVVSAVPDTSSSCQRRAVHARPWEGCSEMGKLAVAGIGIVIVVGGTLWLSAGSSGGSSAGSSSYQPSTTSGYYNYDVPTYGSTAQQDDSDATPQINPKDVYDLGSKAGEHGWNKYQERTPRIPHVPRVDVQPHIRLVPIR
jgi:hypothetical protein